MKIYNVTKNKKKKMATVVNMDTKSSFHQFLSGAITQFQSAKPRRELIIVSILIFTLETNREAVQLSKTEFSSRDGLRRRFTLSPLLENRSPMKLHETELIRLRARRLRPTTAIPDSIYRVCGIHTGL